MPEDNNKQNMTIFVISDSAGETASKLAQAT
ncbi:MAG: phosphoenolpyruvate synthase regulatory protein, partial [Lactococcus lactis]|nr:phosphoenolpyruvate synthase regulatory protein [Lactococcus lactis]